MKTLWAIYLGGRYGDGFIEDHGITNVDGYDVNVNQSDNTEKVDYDNTYSKL